MNENKSIVLQDAAILKVVKTSLNRQNDINMCVIEMKDYSLELFEHSTTVALLTLLLGLKIGISPDKQMELYIAGLLHDYGKLLIPKDILEKRGTLTMEERKIIELHPAAGFLSLKRYTKLSDNIIYAVLDHHEKSDGSGYGSRKDGNSISEYAKIISIVDIYDAMASDRAYRKAIDINIVKEYLCMSAGRSLDYDFVMHFIDVINENTFVELKERHKEIVQKIVLGAEFSELNRDLYRHAER
jgi:HD-GYP domain-containing protein (c-di-GMP phosphodiesterase class II)